MVKQLILVGSGGCMRELLWQIEELNKKEEIWEVLGYVDVASETGSVRVGETEYPYLGTDEYLLNSQEQRNVAICVGSPELRRKLTQKLMANPKLEFPNLILSNTCICPDVQMGKGNIISMDCRISTNVAMGDFNFLNMGAVICHDGRLGNYNTLSPQVCLAGNVTLGSGTELGMGTRVIQGVAIGENVVTGAGSVVVRDISNGCKVVGVPAKEKTTKMQ